jgi:hypothetical protein
MGQSAIEEEDISMVISFRTSLHEFASNTILLIPIGDIYKLHPLF